MGPDETFAEFVNARGADLSCAAFLLAGEQVAAESLLHGALVKTVRQWERLSAGGDPDNFVRQAMLMSTWFWWWHRPGPRNGRFATSVLPDRPLPQPEPEPEPEPEPWPHDRPSPSAYAPPGNTGAAVGPAPGSSERGSSDPGNSDLGNSDLGNSALESAVLAAVLPRLTPRQRVVLYLRFGEDASDAEAARRLRTSAAAVARHLRAALKRLRELAPGLLAVPAPNTGERTWGAYQRLGASVSGFASVDEVRTGAGRQRRTGAVVAAIPLAAIVLVVAGSLTGSGERRSQEAQPDQAVERAGSRGTEPGLPGFTIDPDRWRQLDGDAPPAGTLLITVDDGRCEWVRPCRTYLRTADGEQFWLHELLPNLTSAGPVGLTGSTWSPDGRWLGLHRADGYEFQDLTTGERQRIPNGPPGSFYHQPVGWSGDSTSALLVRIEDGEVAGYVVFDTRSQRIEAFPRPSDERLWPVGVGSAGEFLVAEPDREGTVVAANEPPVGTALIRTLGVRDSGEGDFGGGDIGDRRSGEAGWGDGAFLLDVEAELRRGETIVGPGTVPEIARPVQDGALGWVTVFRSTSGGPRPSAVVYVGRGQHTRVDLPQPSEGESGGESWRLLGPMGEGVAMLHRPGADSTAVDLVQVTALGRRVIAELPANAEILLPGMPG